MTPPPRIPTGTGALSEFVRWTIDSIRALQPIPTPGMLTTTGPRGVSQRPINGPTSAAPAATSPQSAIVLAVLPNHLVVEMAATGGVPTLVQKPSSLHVHYLPEFDSSVLTTFMAGGGTPGSTPHWGWFTNDYVMQGDKHFDSLSGVDLSSFGGTSPAYSSAPWNGGAQSRSRLVTAPMRDAHPLAFGSPVARIPQFEVVWPPYVPLNGIGGISAGGSSTILVQEIPGIGWHDLNVDARRWVEEGVTSGEQTTYTPIGGGFGMVGGASLRW